MCLALVTAAVNLKHVHQPRYVTAEAHGQGCGLRASTSPQPPSVSSYSRASHVPHNLPLHFTVGLPLHSRRPSSTSLCCQGSVPLPSLRYSVPRLFRSRVILPLGNRPPAFVRLETDLILSGVPGTLCCRRCSTHYVTAESHGLRCGIRAFTSLLTQCRHPKEPVPPTSCVSETPCSWKPCHPPHPAACTIAGTLPLPLVQITTNTRMSTP